MSGFLHLIAAYPMTSPALSSTPPTISVSQCTPDKSLAKTINTVNAAMAMQTHRLNLPFVIRLRNCIAAVVITHKERIVVEDG